MPTVTPASIIYGLQKMTWRAIESPPYDIAGFKFSHSQAEKRFPYKDGAAHDWTGLDPIEMPFQFYFVNTLKQDAFPKLWEQWRVALFDGTPGTLEHPLLGPMDAVVKDGSVELKAQMTAGVLVNVTFLRTLRNPEQADTFEGLTVSAKALAGHADDEAEKLGITYPDGAPGSTSFLDLISQIEGEILFDQMKALGKLHQLQGQINSVLGALDTAVHTPWALAAVLKQLYGATLDVELKLGASQARRTGTVTFPQDTTFGDVAAQKGNSVTDLLGLNLQLARSPLIPKGTPVLYYR